MGEERESKRRERRRAAFFVLKSMVQGK